MVRELLDLTIIKYELSEDSKYLAFNLEVIKVY